MDVHIAIVPSGVIAQFALQHRFRFAGGVCLLHVSQQVLLESEDLLAEWTDHILIGRKIDETRQRVRVVRFGCRAGVGRCQRSRGREKDVARERRGGNVGPESGIVSREHQRFRGENSVLRQRFMVLGFLRGLHVDVQVFIGGSVHEKGLDVHGAGGWCCFWSWSWS